MTTQTLTPMTKEQLANAILRKAPDYTCVFPQSAAEVADAIKAYSLERVIAGSHMGKTITIGALFESLYGERLSLKR